MITLRLTGDSVSYCRGVVFAGTTTPTTCVRSVKLAEQTTATRGCHTDCRDTALIGAKFRRSSNQRREAEFSDTDTIVNNYFCGVQQTCGVHNFTITLLLESCDSCPYITTSS